MVRNWSGVGGFSTTSRLKFRGPAEGLEAGYGDERDALRSLRAAWDGGEEGL